ncbi:MAG: RNA methyltransferase [Bacteroidales bacterium]|nr:RNA methyltransferase [Candidatus Sodaliphilus aphodohippi]
MTDINNGIIKTVRSLATKKHRDDEGLFVAEGTKCVRDTWDAFNCRWLIATRSWYDQCGHAGHREKLVFAGKQQMERMSQFSTPSEVIAVYEIPQREVNDAQVRNGLNIVLDNIQDPGNLGTIIRLADWYGISNIFANKTTVDVYNHKVVQATMGAIARVNVHYCDLEELFEQYRELPVYGTFLDGENIYAASLEQPCFVVMGNEGQGIGAKVERYVDRRLLIPASPRSGSESLNVGIATAITISEFMRSKLAKPITIK